MSFADPSWLVIAVLAFVTTAALVVWSNRRARRALLLLVGAQLVSKLAVGVSPRRRMLKSGLLIMGVFALALALAGPRFGHRLEPVTHRGVDLLVAIDMSKSMLARDIAPDRLTRAKLAVSDLLEKFPGNRVGLVPFAGDAFLQTPMTHDHGVVEEALAVLDPTIIPRGGSNIAAAITTAREAFTSQPNRQKLLVLLSDGEALDGDAIAAAKEAAADGVRIFTVGVGTAAGEIIPAAGDAGRNAVVRNSEGEVVRSQLDEKTLRAIASAAGGAYALLGTDGGGLEALYRDHLASLPKTEAAGTMRRVPYERFQWPLAAALAALALERLLGDRRRRTPGPPAGASPSRHTIRSFVKHRRRHASDAALPLAGAMALALLVAPRAHAQDRAAPAQEPSDGAIATLKDGLVAYRNGEMDKASELFGAARAAPRIETQATAYYDLGNALYRKGSAALSGQNRDSSTAIVAWRNAIAAYDGALALLASGAAHDDAAYNREYVRQKLAQLEQEQREDRKESDKQEQQPQEQQGQQQQQQGQQQQQQQQQQEQQGEQQQKQQAQQGHQGRGQNEGARNDQSNPNEQGGDDSEEKSAAPEKGKDASPKAEAGQRGERDEARRGPGGNESRTPSEASAEEPGGKPHDEAGAMSPEEARRLLDVVPHAKDHLWLSAPSAAQNEEQETSRDW